MDIFGQYYPLVTLFQIGFAVLVMPFMVYAFMPQRHLAIQGLSLLMGYGILIALWGCFGADLEMGTTGLGLSGLGALVVIKGLAAVFPARDLDTPKKVESNDSVPQE